MSTAQWKLNTTIGPLFLVASEKGLQEVLLEKSSTSFAKSLGGSDPAVKVLAKAVQQLEEYFEGKRQEFDLPFDVQGTPFQKKVWTELSRIPYGKTCSYGDVAKRIKQAKAMRAVGTANGKNPLCVVVPCHRVIAADGSLGGYSGGLDVKKKLLKLEGSWA